MRDIHVEILLEKYEFNGVGIILKCSPTFEEDLISFVSCGKNLVMLVLDFDTLKVQPFPWLLVSGKYYTTFQDFEKGFPRGMESQLEREEIAKKARGEKIVW